ncbi:hypothetical protein V1J52_22075 [Streptomyces sp. TRM 70351]|uniref:hypothetical protein n=1 Tax=Streptomyces sp. TRM 70351 TaxID=3116552 RepID=UPI002E7AB2AC|nr:hypothetical protein [Streptomyces sp. TRM 70351]MEE1930837.1 hypothetical protein [Streptomyces sp. TRM 70351]
MASVIRRQEVAFLVDFHGFALQEYDDMEFPASFPEGREVSADRPFLTAYGMRLDFESAAHTHTAVMVTEVWDAEPPQNETVWEAEGEAQLVSVTGRLSVEVIAGSAPSTVELGIEGMRWQVRAYSSGRAAVAQLAADGVPRRGALPRTVLAGFPSDLRGRRGRRCCRPRRRGQLTFT